MLEYCRAMASYCRQRTQFVGEESTFWSEEATQWERLLREHERPDIGTDRSQASPTTSKQDVIADGGETLCDRLPETAS